MHSGILAGSVRKLSCEDVALENVFYSSHGYGVQETLALGKALDMLPAIIVVYGIEISDFPKGDPAQSVSVEVLEGVKKATGLIRKEVLSYA